MSEQSAKFVRGNKQLDRLLADPETAANLLQRLQCRRIALGRAVVQQLQPLLQVELRIPYGILGTGDHAQQRAETDHRLPATAAAAGAGASARTLRGVAAESPWPHTGHAPRP